MLAHLGLIIRCRGWRLLPVFLSYSYYSTPQKQICQRYMRYLLHIIIYIKRINNFLVANYFASISSCYNSSCHLSIFVSLSFEGILPCSIKTSAALYKKFWPSTYTLFMHLIIPKTSTGTNPSRGAVCIILAEICV